MSWRTKKAWPGRRVCDPRRNNTRKELINNVAIRTENLKQRNKLDMMQKIVSKVDEMSGNVAAKDHQKNISLPLDSNLGYLPDLILCQKFFSFFLRTIFPEELRHKITQINYMATQASYSRSFSWTSTMQGVSKILYNIFCKEYFGSRLNKALKYE